MPNPFRVNDIITCTSAGAYSLTEGGRYTVMASYPEYVAVLNDKNAVAKYYYARFILHTKFVPVRVKIPKPIIQDIEEPVEDLSESALKEDLRQVLLNRPMSNNPTDIDDFEDNQSAKSPKYQDIKLMVI